MQFSITSLEQVAALVLSLAFVALVIERAVEVYVSKRYDPEKQRLSRPLTRAETRLAKAEKLLAEERDRRHTLSRPASQEENNHLQELTKAAEHAHEKVDQAEELT